MISTAWRPRPALLLIPLALSVAPWLLTVALLHATGEDVEGGMLGTALIGALSFLLTAPIAGFVLAILTSENPIVFMKFAGLFFLVSAPALGFQIINYSMSIMPALLNVGASPQLDSTQFKLVATALGVVWYSVFLVLFYRTARGNARQTFVVASLLVSVSFVFFATRLLH